jgi:ribosomal-protein-alanine N-acetyltransferase
VPPGGSRLPPGGSRLPPGGAPVPPGAGRLLSPDAAPEIVGADARHLEALMVVMRASFDPAFGEAWSALQLGGTMALDSSFARQAIDAAGVAQGFTLSRSAGPEVELLLIAVHPGQRGLGLGRSLVHTACHDAVLRGAEEIFLEVRENNQAALALYRQAGFQEVGRRPDYYAGASGARFAALTMRRRLDNYPA